MSFVSEDEQNNILASQLSMSPKTIQQLRAYGVTEDSALKLEYFFYTDSCEKAEGLTKALVSMGYTSDFGNSAVDENIKLITGWTNPVPMSDQAIIEWTGAMCKLGFSHDCEFDGWGTYSDQ